MKMAQTYLSMLEAKSLIKFGFQELAHEICVYLINRLNAKRILSFNILRISLDMST